MKIPCKDCITLPICKQNLERYSYNKFNRLIEKCSLLNNFLGATTLDFYGGVPLLIYTKLKSKDEKELNKILGWKDEKLRRNK